MDFSKRPGKKIKKIGVIENNVEPVISIITPFYNGGKTLKETANTILRQTYPFFEWIIIDDGSTDKESLKELEKVSRSDSRIRVLHKENGGPSQARDFGISNSSKSSKYIYFLDCDDLIENTMLEVMYWTLETHKEASFVYPSIINFGDLEYYWEPYFTLEEELVNNVMCISTMIRKDDLLEVGCFQIKEKAMYEDWNLWLKLLAKGKIPIRINAPLFWYRNSNTGELSRSKKNHGRAMELINSTIKTIKNDVNAIQFPKMCEDGVTNINLSSMYLPKYKYEDDNKILFILPELTVNIRNIFDFEFIKRLSKNGYNCILITTDPIKDDLRQDIQDYVTEFYDMTNFLDCKDYPLFVDYLISSRNISSIFVHNSKLGYALLPYIRDKYPKVKIVDYIDIEYDNIKYTYDLDKVIDMTLTSSEELYDKIKKKNMVLLGNSINVNKNINKYNIDKIKDEYGITKNKKVISFIDRISYEQGPSLFLKVAQNLLKENDDLVFIMSGNGMMFEDIKDMIYDLNLEKNVYLFNQEENPDKLYIISDIFVSCALENGIPLSCYKALTMGVPIVTSNASKIYELINDSIGRIIPIVHNKRSVKLKKQIYDYTKAINEILGSLDEYKQNTKNMYAKISSSFDSIYEDFNNMFKNLKTKKTVNENFPLLVYSYYLQKISPYFNELYKTYYEENLYIVPKEDTNTTAKLSSKKKLRAVALKYRIENEMHYIFNFLKDTYKMLQSFASFFIGFVKFVIFLFPTIWKFIVLCIRFIKVLLVKLKRKLLKEE